MNFNNTLLSWYEYHKRPLDWRGTRDPYCIWLSEIILQQTQVKQGLPYYRKFIKSYPSVAHLAKAPEQEILKHWQGLGYYSRALNLHTTAKYIHKELRDIFPDNYKDLIKLKGVGDYTASAIASMCFDEAVPTVDGNVYRVLARYFGIDKPINTCDGSNYFKKIATKVMAVKQIATYNQAIMEFGAIQCKPRSPNCECCPLENSCVARSDGKVNILPVKIKRLKIKKRYFSYLIIKDSQEQTIINQRLQRDIWYKLYQFPLIEADKVLNKEELLVREDFQKMTEDCFGLQAVNIEMPVHKLTHQHIYVKFWEIKSYKSLSQGISWKTLNYFPMPVLLSKFLDKFEKKYLSV